MTVSATYSPPQYAGNGATTAFGFPFQFFAPADLVVNLFDTAALANVAPQPVLNGAGTYDYTITGTLDPNIGEYLSGATITFNNAPLGNHRITITRNVAPTQPAVLTNNAAFPAKTVEGQLDRAALLVQQLLATFALAVQRSPSDPVGAPVVLPPDATLRGNYLGFDSATPANLPARAPPANTTAVSAAMAPVIGAATRPAGRAALGGIGALAIGAGLGDDGAGNLALIQTINAQAGAAYAVAAGDRDKLVTRSNAAAMADTLPNPATVTAGWQVDYACLPASAGAVTITPAAGTIDSYAAITLQPGEGCHIETDGVNYFTQRGLGRIAQVMSFETGALATGTTLMPNIGNTQITNAHGDQYMAQAVTPTNNNSTLLIDIVAFFSHSASGVGGALTAALCQDAIVNALAAGTARSVASAGLVCVAFRHKIVGGLVAGTPTTFKVRAGQNGSAGTTSFNGEGGNQLWVNGLASSITITEILP